MKHIYSTPLLSLLLLGMNTIFVSCGDEPTYGRQPDASKYITFGIPGISLNGSVSRSGVENEINGDFCVYGYCAPRDISNTSQTNWNNAQAGWNSKSAYVSPHVFSAQKVEKDGKYSLDPNVQGKLKAWETAPGLDPLQFKYSFIAYYPFDNTLFTMNARTAGGNVAATEMGVPTLTFNMPFSGTDQTVRLDPSQIKDAMIAAVFDHTQQQGTINFRFEHLLSAFRFKINNYTNLRLQIDRVELVGTFFKTAEIDFAKTTVARPQATGAYSGTFVLLDGNGTPQQIPSQSEAGDFLGVSPDNNSEGISLMLLTGINSNNLANYNYLGPGTAVPHLVIDYSVYNEQNNTLVSEYNNVTTSFSPANPAAGVRYTVNLNFVGNEFILVFTPEGDSWEGDHDNDIIIN